MKLIKHLQACCIEWKNSTSLEVKKHPALNLPSIKLFLFAPLIAIFVLSGCTTTPIRDRNLSEAGGFWEQDENTDPRFNHGSITGKETIGVLYASGSNTMLNGSRVDSNSEIMNNALVTTGPASGARIDFKEGSNFCLIKVEDFSIGKGYGDTANCQHYIATKHAAGETHNTIYHIDVSQLRTEFTVLRGTVRLTLASDASKTVQVNSGEEAILTADSISGPHPVSLDEILRRIRWRENHQFSKSEIDWTKVLIGAGVGAAAATAIILHKSGGKGPGSGPSSGPGTIPRGTTSTTPSTTTRPGATSTETGGTGGGTLPFTRVPIRTKIPPLVVPSSPPPTPLR